MKKINDKNRDVWTKLYKTAERFRDLKPWNLISETDIFGVQNPETGEMGYCCIMGVNGEHMAISIYIGDAGFDSYLSLANLEETGDDVRTVGLNQQCLMVSFEDRSGLREDELEVLKALGIKCRGKNNYIAVRDHSPGLCPWYIREDQIEYLNVALEQAMHVAEKFDQDETYLYPTILGLIDNIENIEEELCLVRIPEKRDNKLVWYDKYLPFPEAALDAEEEGTILPPDPYLVQQAKKNLEKKEVSVLVGIFYLPTPVKEGERPYFPILSTLIGYPKGYILGFELLDGESKKSYSKILYKHLETLGFIPGSIVVNSYMAEEMVFPLADELDMEVIVASEETIFKDVIESFFENLT